MKEILINQKNLMKVYLLIVKALAEDTNVHIHIKLRQVEEGEAQAAFKLSTVSKTGCFFRVLSELIDVKLTSFLQLIDENYLQAIKTRQSSYNSGPGAAAATGRLSQRLKSRY